MAVRGTCCHRVPTFSESACEQQLDLGERYVQMSCQFVRPRGPAQLTCERAALNGYQMQRGRNFCIQEWGRSLMAACRKPQELIRGGVVAMRSSVAVLNSSDIPKPPDPWPGPPPAPVPPPEPPNLLPEPVPPNRPPGPAPRQSGREGWSWTGRTPRESIASRST